MSYRNIRRAKQKQKYPAMHMAYKPFPTWVKLVWWATVLVIGGTVVYYAVDLVIRTVHILGG